MTDDDRFVYAKIDVSILRHRVTMKLLSKKGGEGAFAVYIAAICWCRDQMSDGSISRETINALLSGAGARHVDRLIEVGWFIPREDGDFDVWNYAKKNDTRAAVEDRRRKTRERVSSHRSKKHDGNALHDGYSHDSNARVPASASALYASGSGSGQEGDPGERTPGGDESGVHLVAAPTDIPLTPDLIASCELAGAPRPTREHAQAFLANARAKGKVFVDWSEGLKLWMLRQKQFDSAARVRAVPSTQPLAPARARSEFTAAEAIAEGERQLREGVI